LSYLANTQTNQNRQKHNLLGGDKNVKLCRINKTDWPAGLNDKVPTFNLLYDTKFTNRQCFELAKISAKNVKDKLPTSFRPTETNEDCGVKS